MRLQRTRWGSCSAQRTVSLNAALLLLEPELVRYLMVHELCHLRCLDHSRRYWRLVERFEPDFRTLDRRLTDAWPLLPPWLFAGRKAG
jgi:predicted metal-dependent hydrolase